MRVISEQWSDFLGWIRDASSVFSTNSVEVLLTRFQTRHLKTMIKNNSSDDSHVVTNINQ